MDGNGDEAFAILFAQEFNGAHTARAPAAPSSRKFLFKNCALLALVQTQNIARQGYVLRHFVGHTIDLREFEAVIVETSSVGGNRKLDVVTHIRLDDRRATEIDGFLSEGFVRGKVLQHIGEGGNRLETIVEYGNCGRRTSSL